jgi:hypothetical protein
MSLCLVSSNEAFDAELERERFPFCLKRLLRSRVVVVMS